MTELPLSEKNPLLKEIRRAASRGELTSGGLAVAEGFHLLEEALGSRCEIPVVIAAENVLATVATHLRGLKRTRVVSVTEEVFTKLATTESPQGVIALVRPPQWTLDQLVRGKPLVVVLDAVQDGCGISQGQRESIQSEMPASLGRLDVPFAGGSGTRRKLAGRGAGTEAGGAVCGSAPGGTVDLSGGFYRRVRDRDCQ
jgi:hypothetical protein